MKTTGFLKEHKGTPTPWLMQIRFTLTSLIKGHVHLFFSRKKSSLPSDFHVIIENSTLPASTVDRVAFLSYPFIIAYPFIREVRVGREHPCIT